MSQEEGIQKKEFLHKELDEALSLDLLYTLNLLNLIVPFQLFFQQTNL